MTQLILCPTRGGEASQPNQDRAIALAEERGAELLFLYVTNVEFLVHTARAKLVDMESQIDQLGDFLLAMAQERAQNAGVTAQTVVRRGEFRQVLIDLLAEHPVIDTIILGSAGRDSGAVTADYIHNLGQDLSSDHGIEFIILYHGEILKSYCDEN